MGALVFVTMELSPFTPGGIGRVVHNLLKSMSAQDRQRSWVLGLDCKIDEVAFASAFPGVSLLMVDSRDESRRYENGTHQPPRRAFGHCEWQWKSTVVFRALRSLTRVTEIDYVEFPDFGAFGFATVQEKRITGFLGEATLAVRLHTSHALLLDHESYVVSDADRYLVDLERKTIRDCDLLIAQVSPVGDKMRRVLGLPPCEWEPRLVLHAPPVLLDTCTPRTKTSPSDPTMPIMFGSKIQAVKRPDLFVRGVSAYCHANPSYTGDVAISAHSFYEPYRDAVLRLVPPDLSARFHFDLPKHSVAREPLIAKSTFVVPSDFESFCLAAYEASLLGARVVLNGTNPAFGDGTPWQDGVNCYKFDGTALGLQKALERSFAAESPLQPVEVPADPWPWNARISSPARDTNGDQPLVSVLIPHFNLGRYLPSTLASVLEQTYSNIEIIVVDDCSTDEASREFIGHLRSNQRPGLKIVTPPGNIGLAAARNLGIEHARGEYVLPLDADDLIDLRFIETAVRALQRNPEFDVFVTPAGYFRDEDEVILPGEEADFRDYAVFVGEALVSGFRQNRFSTATSLIRTDVLRKHRYVESLRCYEDWSLYLRLAKAGHRFLVANYVYFHYRNRPNSMVKAAQMQVQHAAFVHDMLRTALDASCNVPLAYLAMCEHEPKLGAIASSFSSDTKVLALLIAGAQQKILVSKMKQLLLYPIPKARRRYRAKIREWKRFRNELSGRLKGCDL
jgi:glycosyltransferase involved in cell wall biosynthesis